MRLPRRGFTPPRNDMRFMVAVPNAKLQLVKCNQRIIATIRAQPNGLSSTDQPSERIVCGHMPAKLQFESSCLFLPAVVI